jgi:hypothetical protein
MVTDGIIASHIPGGTFASSAQAPSAASTQRFEEAYSRAVSQLDGPASAHTGASAQTGQSNSLATLLDPLLKLNSSSTQLAERSGDAALADMKPSELMMLTMRSHEFLFHCELVANVANRSSDGVQQLFRQQS